MGLVAGVAGAQGTSEVDPEPFDVDPEYYFYHGRDFGSESLIHPLRLVLNGGFGILKLDNRDNSPWEVDYSNGWQVVRRNIADPFGSIQADGWSDFLQREIIPVSVNSGRAQYWPNYTQHLIGGGMSYRMMVEWFRWHEWSHPKLWGGTMIMGYHVLNEIVEASDAKKWTTDPVADLLIFDPLSIWLFSSDRVAGFFSHKLNMADWSYQPAYNPSSETLENQGQNFAIKLGLPGRTNWRLFYHWGTQAEIGLARRVSRRDDLSVGAGLVAKNLIPDEGNFRTVDLATSAGIWWDREGSLMGSLEWAGSKDYILRLNLYPGLVKWGGVKPGFFGVWHRDDDVTLGVGFKFLPFGIAGQL
jgi:hypothetical protein